MTQIFYFGTNTKMYMTSTQTVEFVQNLVSLTKDVNREENTLFVIPSFISLESARNSVLRDDLLLGGQNVHWEEEGQFTGEISVKMLTDIGADLIMIAHSERRQLFGETDYTANKRLMTTLNKGLIALYCVGESADHKDIGITQEILRTQLLVGLHGITVEQTRNLWIAYEPVWAIGIHGQPADKNHVNFSHMKIRKTLVERFGSRGNEIPILYGGSVNKENATDYATLKSVNGLFIGRSAWDAELFSLIIHDTIASRKKVLGDSV